MARIGLAVAGAAIGALFGPVGAQIGFTLGGVLGGMLFPGKLPSGPRLNDLIVSTATDGAPIPIVYGQARVSANIIWAPPIVETSKTKSVKGGPKQTTYSYTASFAAAFCEGGSGPSLGSSTDGSYLDAAAMAGGQSPAAGGSNPNTTLTPSIASEVVLSYRLNSNTNPTAFSAPWTALSLNVNAIGKLGWQKINSLSAVVDTWSVPGTQAWANAICSFGAVGTPVFTSLGSGNNSLPVNLTNVVIPSGVAAFAFIEGAANATINVGATVSDSLGNRWTNVGVATGSRPAGPQTAQISVWYCTNTIGGTATITIGGNSAGASVVYSLFTATGLVGVSLNPLPSVGRIWFDSKVVYDSRATKQANGSYQFTAPITGSSNVGSSITVQSILNPPVSTEVIISGAAQGNGTFQVTQSTPTQFVYYNPKAQAPGSSGTAAMPPIKYAPPVIYPGSETQTADPTIQAAVGAANCSAFRGLLYAVWTNFPLNDFGNRLPNVRGEIATGYTTQVPYSLDGTARTATGNQTTPISVTSATPGSANEWAIYMAAPGGVFGPLNNDVGGSWALFPGMAFNNYGALFQQVLPNANPITATESIANASGEWWSAMIALFNSKPTIKQVQTSPTVLGSNPTWQISFSFTGVSALTAGNDLLVFVAWNAGGGNGIINPVVNDTQGNVYKLIGKATNPGQSPNFDSTLVGIFQAKGVQAGANTVTLTVTGPASVFGGSCSLTLVEVNPTVLVTALVGTTTAIIVQDICTRSGLLASDIDTSGILSLPAPGGYVISRPTTGKAAIAPLSTAFFFDGVESGGVLKFVPRGGATQALTVPETDLGLMKDKAKLTEQLGMAQEIPREVQVLYLDRAKDYQQGKSQKRRHTRIVKTKNQTIIELPMTIDSTTARQIAEKSVFLAALERHPYDTNLWKSLYLLYDPTDVIQFVYEGLTFVARVVRSGIGLDFTSSLSMVSEDQNSYLSQVIGSSGTGVTPTTAKNVPDTVLFLFDIPLLRDTDANPGGSGIYFAMSSLDPTHWPGASLQKSSDNINFSEENTGTVAAHYGTASNILGPPPSRGLGGSSPWVWDTVNTLNIVMQNGTLAGTSDLNVYNGANAILYGNEVLQFANCVQNLDGSFTVSRLLRGRRGTEVYCGTHTVNEMVVDLGSVGLIRQAEPTSNLQVLRYYQGVTSGSTVVPANSQLFTEVGQDLMPYAPAQLAGVRDSSSNLAISWVRRTRIGGDWLNGIGTVSLSETVESYDVEIMNGSNVVRTFAGLGSPAVVYSAAQQISDFGLTPAAITFNVYQNSSIIGRGFKATARV